MAEACQQCSEREARGTLGSGMRLCYSCCAGTTGESQKALRSRRIQFALTRGRRFLGFSVWVPDWIAARDMRRKQAVASGRARKKSAALSSATPRRRSKHASNSSPHQSERE